MQKTIAGLNCRVRPGDSDSHSVILLHGFGADSSDLFGLADALDPHEKWNFYFPNAPLEVPIGPMWTGRAWFPISLRDLEVGVDWTQIRPPGLDSSSKQVFDLVFELNCKNLVIGGFSQGAMVATEVALKNPGEVSALIAYSGVLLDEPNWSKLAKEFDKPILQSHGRQDPVLPFSAALRLSKVLGLDSDRRYFLEFDGGHEIPAQAIVRSRALLEKLS